MRLIKCRMTLFILSLLSFIVACSNASEVNIEITASTLSNDATVQEFTVSHGEATQKFTVISAYEGMYAYIEEARNISAPEELKVLFMKHVFLPIWDACYRDGEYVDLITYYTANPPQNLNTLERTLNTMSKRNIEEIVIDALIKSAEALPGPDTQVCILPYTDFAMGVGVNIGSGKITQFYSEFFRNSDADIAGTIAHEYHHSYWTDKHYDKELMDLVNYLVFEGRAESFKKHLYPEAAIVPLTSQQEIYYWDKVKDKMTSLDYEEQNHIMFGGNGYPEFYGYGLGYLIVQKFLENNPDLSIVDWTALDGEEILDGSDYENSLGE